MSQSTNRVTVKALHCRTKTPSNIPPGNILPRDTTKEAKTQDVPRAYIENDLISQISPVLQRSRRNRERSPTPCYVLAATMEGNPYSFCRDLNLNGRSGGGRSRFLRCARTGSHTACTRVENGLYRGEKCVRSVLVAIGQENERQCLSFSDSMLIERRFTKREHEKRALACSRWCLAEKLGWSKSERNFFPPHTHFSFFFFPSSNSWPIESERVKPDSH